MYICIEPRLDPPDPEPTTYGKMWLGCYQRGYEAGRVRSQDRNPYNRQDFKDAWDIGYGSYIAEHINKESK